MNRNNRNATTINHMLTYKGCGSLHPTYNLTTASIFCHLELSLQYGSSVTSLTKVNVT